MKLSKKSAAVQRAIHKALASGKALGGLIVGLAATVAGCRDHHTPANTMGDYPASPPLQQENTQRNCRAIPGEPPEPQPAKTNVVNESKKRKANRFMGKVPASPGKVPASPDDDTSK